MLRCLPLKFRLLLVAGLALLLAGCQPDPYASISTRITVTFDSEGFSPHHWKVPSGEEIELILDNPTAAPRVWMVMARPVELPFQEADRGHVFFEAAAPASETKSCTFTAPQAPGEYDVLLEPSAQVDEGWVGKLIVYESSFLKEIGRFPEN